MEKIRIRISLSFFPAGVLTVVCVVVRVNLTTACDIDIPGPAQDTTTYCATLAHKANHSFTASCVWTRIDHPRFGLICSLTAARRICPGEEITVNYGLPLHIAPDWYKVCHRQFSGRGGPQ